MGIGPSQISHASVVKDRDRDILNQYASLQVIGGEGVCPDPLYLHYRLKLSPQNDDIQYYVIGSVRYI